MKLTSRARRERRKRRRLARTLTPGPLRTVTVAVRTVDVVYSVPPVEIPRHVALFPLTP